MYGFFRAFSSKGTSTWTRNYTRTKFGVASIVGGVGLLYLSSLSTAAEANTDIYKLQPLPYGKNSLEPHISQETVEYHYERHHRGYLTKLNELAKGTPLAKKSLEDIVLTEQGKPFNLAAQVWNHTFYWECMAPNAGGRPTGKLLNAIEDSFGSYDVFHQQFTTVAANHFGSGWAWLVRDKNSNKLSIIDTHDAGNPLTHNKVPLLTCDVWEHAYYIDKRNNRGEYINSWWNLVDWKKVEQRLL